jgi:hypothetical protein
LLSWAIPITGQKTVEDSVIKQPVDKLKLLILDIYGRAPVIAQLYNFSDNKLDILKVHKASVLD